MPFNINTFRNNVHNWGTIKSNSYELVIALPKIFEGNPDFRNIPFLIKFRTQSIQAPGISILAMENNVYGVGPEQKMPVNAKFNDISVSILCDKFGIIWDFWHKWLNSVFQFSPNDTGNNYTHAFYNVGYKEDYCTRMQMTIFDNTGTPAQYINFYDIFPIEMKEMDYDWEEQNKLVQLRISLSYREYTIVNPSNAANIGVTN